MALRKLGSFSRYIRNRETYDSVSQSEAGKKKLSLPKVKSIPKAIKQPWQREMRTLEFHGRTKKSVAKTQFSQQWSLSWVRSVPVPLPRQGDSEPYQMYRRLMKPTGMFSLKCEQDSASANQNKNSLLPFDCRQTLQRSNTRTECKIKMKTKKTEEEKK